MNFRDTKSKLAKVVGIVDEGENLSLKETIVYSLISGVGIPFATSGVGALIGSATEYGAKTGALIGGIGGGFVALLAVTELMRKYREGKRQD